MAVSILRSLTFLLPFLLSLLGVPVAASPDDPSIALIVDDKRVESRLHNALRRQFGQLAIRNSLSEARAAADETGVDLAVQVSTTRTPGESCPYGNCFPTCDFRATAQVFLLPVDLEFSVFGRGTARDCATAGDQAATELLEGLSPRLKSYLIQGSQLERDYLWVELPDLWSEDQLAKLRADLEDVSGVLGIEPDWDDHLIQLEVNFEPDAVAKGMSRFNYFRVNRVAGRRMTLGLRGQKAVPVKEAETGSKSVPPIRRPFELDSSETQYIPTAPGTGRKWALVIGVSSFEDESIPPLKYTARDAKAFAETLTHPEIGRFSADEVVLLQDDRATTRRIKMELDLLARQTQPEDLFLFFISTHAVPGQFDAAGDAYLVTHDTEKASLYATGFAMEDLVRALTERIQARTVVGILDACHTGQIVERTQEEFEQVESDTPAPRPAPKLSWQDEWTELSAKSIHMEAAPQELPSRQPKKIVFLSSSDGHQKSWESEEVGHGFFTYYLMSALRQSKGGMKLDSLYDLLKVEVPRAVLAEKGKQQMPQLFFTQDADFEIGYKTAE